MQYSDKDLEMLISEVETEFAAYLHKNEENAEETKLTKSEEESSSEEVLGYDEEDFKEMNELYSSMSKSEKEAHYQAIKSVLFEEEESSDENSEEESTIAKSEEEKVSESSELLAKHEELVQENENLKKSVEKLLAVLTDKVKQSSVPQQKAITSIEYIKKSEGEEEVVSEKSGLDITKLSKSEVIAKLRERARSEDLTKSDREKIDAYVLNNIDINEIKNLL